MFALIFTILFGIVIAYFATQNTIGMSIHFGSVSLQSVPVYLVVLVSLLIGLSFAWIFHLLSSLSSSFTIRGKDHALAELQKENIKLKKEMHELEVQNAHMHNRQPFVKNQDEVVEIQ